MRYTTTMQPVIELPSTKVVLEQHIPLSDMKAAPLLSPPHAGQWTVKETHVVVFGGFPMLWVLWETPDEPRSILGGK